MPMPLESPGQPGVFYWRTWYLDKCEALGLFGLTAEQAKYAQNNHFGTGAHVYLVNMSGDLPGSSRHSVSGPFEVGVASSVPHDAEIILGSKAQPVVYKEPHPERGPWHGDVAHDHGFFPYRFAMHGSRASQVGSVACERAPGHKCFYCGRV